MAAAADIIPCCEGDEAASCGDEMITTADLFLCFFLKETSQEAVFAFFYEVSVERRNIILLI